MQVMANGRVRRQDSEWRELIARWRGSGESIRTFCQKQGIRISSFQRWRRRLSQAPVPQRAEGRSQEASPDFVAVSVNEGALSITSASGWSLEVALPNGTTLRFQG